MRCSSCLKQLEQYLTNKFTLNMCPQESEKAHQIFLPKLCLGLGLVSDQILPECLPTRYICNRKRKKKTLSSRISLPCVVSQTLMVQSWELHESQVLIRARHVHIWPTLHFEHVTTKTIEWQQLYPEKMNPSPLHFTQVTARVWPLRHNTDFCSTVSQIRTSPSLLALANRRHGTWRWAGSHATPVIHFLCPCHLTRQKGYSSGPLWRARLPTLSITCESNSPVFSYWIL